MQELVYEHLTPGENGVMELEAVPEGALEP